MTSRPTPVLDVLGTVTTEPHLARALIEETLSSAILDGRIPSGTTLRQEELARVFGVSRMPVREALLQLQSHALVTIVPNRGAMVTQVTATDAAETYEVRLALEPAALRKSVPHLTVDDLVEAESHVSAMEQTTDLHVLGRENAKFHMCLYRRAGNAKLLRMVESELQDEERLLRFHLAALGIEELAQDDHRALIEAARGQAVEEAVRVLERHISFAAQTIQNYLNRRSTS